jgi:uncharacterized membrane protein
MEKLIIPMPINKKSQTKRRPVMEKPSRSLLKSISWRIVATLTTVVLVFIFGRDLTLASLVGITEFIAKFVIYYVHERVWNLSGFGRERKTK